MSDWLDFEKMISQIYQTISPEALVKHDDSIHGIDSDIDRQIDVSIRFKKAGCDFLIIVQAKNYKTAADINVVGEFATVIKDVRASKGVLICNVGFTQGAQKLATSLGIDLCTAHDAESKDWRTTLTIPIVWQNIIPHVNFNFKAFFEAEDSFSANPKEWILSTDDGETKLDVINKFVLLWNLREIPYEIDKTHTFTIPNSENIKILVDNGEWRKIDEINCIYVVERQLYRKDVSTEEFTGLRNYLNGNLEILKLGVKIPTLDPKHGWVKLEQCLEELLSKEALVITVKGPVLHLDQFPASQTTIVEILDDL